MPIFPWPARGDVPPAGDPTYDALLTGSLLPEDAAEGLRPVAEAFAALIRRCERLARKPPQPTCFSEMISITMGRSA